MQKSQKQQKSKSKRKYINSQDLKRRLYQKGNHGNSMPSLKINNKKQLSHILYVNLNSSQRQSIYQLHLIMFSKNDNINSPKILKKTASAFSQTHYNYKKSFNQKNNNMNSTNNIFNIKKLSNNYKSTNKQDKLSPKAKTSMNFYKQRNQENDKEKEKNNQYQQQIQFNSSFYKNDSVLKQNENKFTKRHMQKMAGSRLKQRNNKRQQKQKSLNQSKSHSVKSKDQIFQKQNNTNINNNKDEVNNNNQKTKTNNNNTINTNSEKKQQKSNLQQYINLILNNVPNVDQFLYLVRESYYRQSQNSNYTFSNSNCQQQDNIYKLQIIDYEKIRQKQKQQNFEYYTISKKGFCHYFNGKPIEFIDLNQWVQEKIIYQKIKKLNFFNRFRRWKTIKMWIKKVVRHRIQKCLQNLEQKLFILNPIIRTCILQIKSINLQMEKNLSLISRNQGTYCLQSFKHCQQKTRRESASIVQEYSHKSRISVKKCFEQNLENLKEILKTKQTGNAQEQKNFSTSHSPKDNAFQALGFPSKMSYQHRSQLRKLTGRFVRFSYLVDIIHLNGLANIFKSQISHFTQKLISLQLSNQIKIIYTFQQIKPLQQNDKQKMFNIELNFIPNYNQIALENYIEEQFRECFDFSMKIDKAAEIFNPLYDIKKKALPQSQTTSGKTNKQLMIHNNNNSNFSNHQDQQMQKYYNRKYIPKICQLWLSLKPNFDNIFDQLSFLIKESMNSLKYFQRWSKHRQMQKYINILQQWDDIVSDNWQINQNDNLDPILIIDNLDKSLNKIKQIIQTSQNKLTQKIINQITESINIYWQNKQFQIQELFMNDQIENVAETIEFYLAYMTQNILNFRNKLPETLQLGIFSINCSKIKIQVIEFMESILENFKNKIPIYIQQKTNSLNIWLNQKSIRLKQQIHNIDDFVRMSKSIKQLESQFFIKKQICNDLGHLYQTMYNFKIQTKKRKDFQVNTLKSKDQLEQLLINVQQNIQRKTQFFTKQVSKYHLPNLIKDIEKINQNIKSQQFQSLKSKSNIVIAKLITIKQQYQQLKQRKQKCIEYLNILKLSQIQIKQLQELQKQINSRLIMWENLEIFEEFIQKVDNQIVKEMDLEKIKGFVIEKKKIVEGLEKTHDNPNNQVLNMLKEKVQKYYTNIPLLQGFNDNLSQNHWQQINFLLKQYKFLDLKKKQFTLKQFLLTQIGNQSKQIQYIFNKARIQNQLQSTYSDIENIWYNTIIKSRIQSKFQIISNAQIIRQSFNNILNTICEILSNPYSQTLKQYSITYNMILTCYNTFQYFILIQQKLLKIDSICKLLDIKKIPDYISFQNSQKIFKNLMKSFAMNRINDSGIKMNKLFTPILDQKLLQIDQNLLKVQDNIKNIIQQHRKTYPYFYLFNDDQLLKIITQPNNPINIQNISKKLFKCIDRLQFQGERISGIYTYDNQKLYKNMISITSDIQQILLQISDTITDINKKNMRSCKYKSIQTNIFKLINVYQSQYLLAINMVDFSNYTEISIDNQLQSPDSLRQFYKVMKKDITQDLKFRQNVKTQHLVRYDSLILQSLYHQNIISQLIKNNISKTTDFQWQKLLRFSWEENNTQENNITIKQAHIKIKYGNQYIGSKCKVLMSNMNYNVLAAVGFNEKVMYNGTLYNLQRTLNFLGHRLQLFVCQKSSTLCQIQNFLIGNWYCQNICYFQRIQILQKSILNQLLQMNNNNIINSIKQNLIKKNTFNIKQNDNKKYLTMFLGLNETREVNMYWEKNRIINYFNLPSLKQIVLIFKIKNLYNNQQLCQFILKLFQIVQYIQQKLLKFNCCIQQFFDKYIIGSTQILTRFDIFQKFQSYIRPFLSLQNLSIIKQIVSIFLTSSTNNTADNVNSTTNQHSHQLNSIKKQQQKKNILSPINLKRISTQSNNPSRNSSQNHNKSSPKFSQHHTTNLNDKKLKKDTIKQKQQILIQSQQELKIREINQALLMRNVVILAGKGDSKRYLVEKMCEGKDFSNGSVNNNSNNINNNNNNLIKTKQCKNNLINLYPYIHSQQINKKQNIIQFYVNQIIQKNKSTLQQQNPNNIQPTYFYIQGITQSLLLQIQLILYYKNKNITQNNINNTLSNNISNIQNFPTTQTLYQKIKQQKINIILTLQNLDKLDYHLYSTFYVIHVQLQSTYLIDLAKKWYDNYLLTNDIIINNKNKQIFNKFYNQTLLVLMDNWGIKQNFIKEKYINIFFTYLKSLLPCSKLLQAMTYCFIRVFLSNPQIDYIKLQFLIKKILGQDKISQEYKLNDLFYLNYQNDQTNNNKENKEQQKLIYLDKNIQLIKQQNNQQKYLFDYIVTPQYYHKMIIMKRILSNTSKGIFITGRQQSGKSSLIQIYKHKYFKNKSYLKLTMNSQLPKQQFINKILNNLSIYSLYNIKSKLNYQKSIMIIDDINMDFKFQFDIKRTQKNYIIQEKIKYLYQMLKYKKVEYPKKYETIINNASNITNITNMNSTINNNNININNSNTNSSNNKFPSISSSIPLTYSSKFFNLSSTQFIFSGRQQHQILQPITINLPINTSQEQYKTIFTQYLKLHLYDYNQMVDNQLLLNDIVMNTFQLCKKLSLKNQQFIGLQLNRTKYILSKYNQLKIKQNCNNIVKQFQKYWISLIYQQLQFYDKKQIQQSLIYNELRNMNLILGDGKKEMVLYSHFHNKQQSITKSKKLQTVKDIKKIYNILNQKIYKYNQSDNKRYGNSLQFINFDQILIKIIKLSNNITRKDYFIYGRIGTGKQSIIKIISYLQGSNYKNIGRENLKNNIMQLFMSTNVTTLSSYIITQKINTLKQLNQLKQFYYMDFQNQILMAKQLDKEVKIYIKDKEIKGNTNNTNFNNTLNGSQNQKLNTTQMQKNFTINNSLFNPQYYITPHPRYTYQQVIRYRDAIRIVILCSNRKLLKQLLLQLKMNLIIDQIQQIPKSAIQQYNIKLLQVDQIKYCVNIPTLITQIFIYQRQKLKLSQKMNDDCVRLFSSFITTIQPEIKQELNKFGRILKLYNKIKVCNEKLHQKIGKLHNQIKVINQQIYKQEEVLKMSNCQEEQNINNKQQNMIINIKHIIQQLKQQKQQIQTQLHKKSLIVNKGQRITQILSLLLPFYKHKHICIYKYIQNRQFFQQSLAIASSYFTYLSQLPFKKRRQILNKWYGNKNIPSLINRLQQNKKIQSFLTLFNLYPQEFNTQPIDDLEDFYQNMAIIFNSVKPVIIKDQVKKSKQWLQSVCSFICVSQKQSRFYDIISQNLIKPSNILLQITTQETLLNLNNKNNLINSLLFLTQNTQTVNIKGQQVTISPQAKFYILVGDGLQIPNHIKAEFTLVTFSQSQNLFNKNLEHTFMTYCHSENLFSQLDIKKKIRNLKLQQQALMLQIGQTLYNSFQKDDQDNSNSDKQQNQQGKMNNTQQISQPHQTQIIKLQQQTNLSQQQFLQLCQNLDQINDKIMTRSQNLSNKLKQKQQLCKQFQSKHDQNIKFINQIKQFIQKCKLSLQIINQLSTKSLLLYNKQFNYPIVSHKDFINKIKKGFKFKYINSKNLNTLILYIMKIYGVQFYQNDYLIFILTILCKTKNIKMKEVGKYLMEIKERNLGMNEGIINNNNNSNGNGIRSRKRSLRGNMIMSNNNISKRQINNQTNNNNPNKNNKKSTTLISQIIPIHCSSIQETKYQLTKNLQSYLLQSFTKQQLLPYIKNNIKQNIFLNSFIDQQQQNNQNIMKLNINIVLGSQNTYKMLQNQLLQNSTLKIIQFQGKEKINLNQNQIKKILLQENILLIQTIPILQTILQNIKKHNITQKTIYYPIQKINISNKLMKKLLIMFQQHNIYYQLFNLDTMKINLFSDGLERVEKYYNSNKNNIGMIDASNIDKMSGGNNVNINSSKNDINSTMNLGCNNNNKNTTNKNIPLYNNNTQTQALQQKPLLITINNLNSPQLSATQLQQKQHQHNQYYILIQLIQSKIQKIYIKYNLQIKYKNKLQIQQIINYIINLGYQNQQIQYTFQDKYQLILNIFQLNKNTQYQPLNKQIRRVIGELLKIIEQKQKQKDNLSKDIKDMKDNIQKRIQYLKERLQKINISNNQSIQITNNNMSKIKKKTQKFEFVSIYLNYLIQYFQNNQLQQQQNTQQPNYNQQTTDLQTILSKSIKLLNNLKNNITIPTNIQRNSRKSINAFFKKQSIKYKISSPNNNNTTLVNLGNNGKKNNLKRISKNSMRMIGKNSSVNKTINSLGGIDVVQGQQNNKSKDNNFVNVNELFFQIQFKKISTKINYLIQKIQKSIKNLLKFNQLNQIQQKKTILKQKDQQIQQNLILILMVQKQQIPGIWHIHLQNIQLTSTNNIIQIFKLYLKIQQDISFNLQKLKRCKNSQINFNFLKYPKQYIEIHFGNKIAVEKNTNNVMNNLGGEIFVINNNPTQQELDQSLGYLKIFNIQSLGWKFSIQGGFIEFVSSSAQKTLYTDNKIFSPCFIIKKTLQIGLNLAPIDVYQDKKSLKPIFKVYGNCKKNTNFNTTGTNLSLYLKDQQQI